LPSSEGTTTYCYAADGLYCTFDSTLLDALSCQPYSDIGDACSETEVRCIPGAFCDHGTCVARQSSGPCADTPDRCEVHGYCDANRQCQAKKLNGEACFSGEECMSSSCSSDGQAAAGMCDSGNTLLARACGGTP
jgi:hypothetical protein